MRILAIGDIVGRPGRRAVAAYLPELRRRLAPDFILANAENAAGGIGITKDTGLELLELGIDLLTMGNHAWGKKEAYAFLEEEARVIRPANYPEGAPGRGWAVHRSRSGVPVAVMNLGGRVFFTTDLDCPFRTAERVLEAIGDGARVVLVDFHAEATSEKIALAHFLDGRVSAVFGTHTHVQTADARVLPGGTAFMTDLGMTGPRDSVIGIKKKIVIERFLTQLPSKFEVASGPTELCGALFDIDEATGLARSVEPVRVAD
ncbi:MAG TPA: TIGR00282 family metallophosphoesterase [Clostridiales bacterium]|nr:TIGR00282 family metallophosphoesterase [Clostridiales bacterium]HCW52047.1 TIGR00282 family metallophosphoesterase [Clostridiales bacterium]